MQGHFVRQTWAGKGTFDFRKGQAGSIPANELGLCRADGPFEELSGLKRAAGAVLCPLKRCKDGKLGSGLALLAGIARHTATLEASPSKGGAVKVQGVGGAASGQMTGHGNGMSRSAGLAVLAEHDWLITSRCQTGGFACCSPTGQTGVWVCAVRESREPRTDWCPWLRFLASDCICGATTAPPRPLPECLSLAPD